MAKGDRMVSDPVGRREQVNIMESGLTHCADSLAGGREGDFIVRFGAPGDPLDKSPGVKSGFAGRTPNIWKKFVHEGQE